MKVIETHEYNNSDHEDVSGVEISIVTDTDKESFSLSEGEREDMYFFRDLSDVLSITGLLKLAYEAGKRGEAWEYEFIDESEE